MWLYLAVCGCMWLYVAVWDAKFKAGGVAAANWEQWKREYLCLSQDLQMMIKEAEA